LLFDPIAERSEACSRGFQAPENTARDRRGATLAGSAPMAIFSGRWSGA